VSNDAGNGPKPRRIRADALRNREQILRATVDLVVERGSTVPLEMIAKRAGVGIATLYRHFPDRMVLLRQVALDLWRQSTHEARTALAEENDAFTALTRYMHNSIDLRIGAIMPVLAVKVPMDEEMLTARQDSREATDEMVRQAHEEESLRPDVQSGDIGLLIIRFALPLSDALAPEDNHRLSHRHMELLLDGLLSVMAENLLPGPTLAIDDLAAAAVDEDTDYMVIADDSGDGRNLCWRRPGKSGPPRSNGRPPSL
jgi:AcrR family transcriptional regulator